MELYNERLILTEDGVIELTAAKEEDIPKLFMPFIRLDSPLKEKTLGTGLGLYLTKKIMQNVFNGNIMVESQYGMGSTFTLIIPLGAVAQ